ncbi:hypothetical protein [Novipirellula artificiosorum]|uniref:HAMP domain-containing protein n=1 Tax=Novipirellula artificiosorum TaxID=2528016 RepID=A0A5C6DZM6_9BACT|nr:hypothetical protein [Novipirellula artificiosorum]TWU40516.1 hypothetical protein Poly41_13490 [Novipirellula artificiosorum]
MSNRSRILVDPKVQWSIAARVMFHWTLFVLCLIAVNVSVRTFAAVINQPFWEAVKSSTLAQAPILVVMAVMLPIFLRDTLVLSNRFAGPMYRLRTAIASVAKGETVSSIKFRDGDFWQDAATEFNTVLNELNTLRQQNAELQGKIEATSEEYAH